MANIVTINEDNNELRVSVTVSNGEYDTHYENELEIAKSAKLDGFRKKERYQRIYLSLSMTHNVIKNQ